ncbi:hypothetical protein DRW03_15535 [Corallococcus sp. H22C18031201]|uniref:hypothetical protein n=1 Tax=Citreicoccus inhibens TaxID=2849499 RepID=UPI000E72617C|nr:hypothetical protein [Citreicoccus inhibens]MBU8900878.1 hypothetical protein [Citreicoccus inhibens]RJS21756.1 hypothetical protein DRW03_15535 [Corallococcus sp. H22C18031201]
MAPEHVASALEQKQLTSAYHREGPEGRYSRPADKNGGGALAVYTRAVGTQQSAWPAKGYGVGSNDSRVQLILSPNVLQTPNHGWRASSTDNGGLVPGATKNDQVGLPQGDPLKRTKQLWGKQTESGRNGAFNATVNNSSIQANNEQLHWEKVPLEGNLKGMVVTSPASFETLMKQKGAQQTEGVPGRGTIQFGSQNVPVVLAAKNSSLLSTLQSTGIADDNGRVR